MLLDGSRPSDVLDLINTATMVIVPSRWFEPAPLVAIQAAHMGRPVVGRGPEGSRSWSWIE